MMSTMRHYLRFPSRRTLSVCVLLLAAQPFAVAADNPRKAKETEAKRLNNLGRTAEKQGRLVDARQQYLASEYVVFNADAEKGLERVAEAAGQQVKALMADAAQAYGSENFTKAGQLLESAGALHPGNLTIGCNLALTRYQQGNRDDALALLDQCVGAMHDKDPRRRLAELFTALVTGNRSSAVAPGARPQLARLNDAILFERDHDVQFDDDDNPVTPPAGGLCAQMKQLEGGLPRDPAMLFNLAKCAESEGRLGDAIRLLTDYTQAAPAALDADEVQARLILLRSLVALPDPKGSMVRAFYTSAARHVEARGYDQAVADYQKADEAIPEFGESKRRVATILEAQGQIERARTYWRQVVLAETADERRQQQTQLVVDGLDGEKAEYDELVGAARLLLHDLVGRSLLEGEPVGRIYAAYRLQLASEKIQSAALLLPLASEANLLQSFTCSQMNDFRCVRASFDAERALTLPVSFYGAVFYKAGDPKNRAQQVRTYGKFEFDKDTLRFAEISTVNPKKRSAVPAAKAAGEDRLGRLGVAEGLRSAGFQGFTVPAGAIKHLETQAGMLYLEVDDKRVKHRKMLIEPLSFVLEVPPTGPGARRYINNYINIAEAYGGVEKAKLGKESTTTGEKLKMVYSIASLGLNVTQVMFGDFFSLIDVARSATGLGRKIALSQRQVHRMGMERRQVVNGVAFKVIPTEPVSLAFRKELK